MTSDTDGGSAAVYQATTDLAAPSDLKAYIVTDIDYDEGTVMAQELAYIPKDVPILLLTENDTPHDADFTATAYTGGGVDVTNNLLCKSNDTAPGSTDWGQYYIFSRGEFVLSMGGKTMKAGKFYFENPNYNSPAPSRSTLRIVRGNTTSINNSPPSSPQTSDTWYTLNGQKLNKKPTRKGIYMQNGKKVVIK